MEIASGGGTSFQLPEAAAILAYLAARYDVQPDSWYPRHDLKAKARVDAALSWWQGALRPGATRVVFNKVSTAV